MIWPTPMLTSAVLDSADSLLREQNAGFIERKGDRSILVINPGGEDRASQIIEHLHIEVHYGQSTTPAKQGTRKQTGRLPNMRHD